MKSSPRHARFPIVMLLVLAIASNFAVRPAKAQTPQRGSVVIHAEQPNIWTLEQAHYLLAQMHRRNLDLKTKGVGELDPNEINGLRFDILKTLLEVGVSYSDADRVTNRLLAENKRFNADRSRVLIARRDELQKESLDLTRNITRLQGDLAAATSEEDKQSLTAEIERKTALRARVDKDIEQINAELATLTSPSGDFSTTTPEVAFDPEKLPTGLLDEAFQENAASLIEKFNQAPRLNASLMLDNFLQMQYEIISKQLTLLRDEVGAGDRLLFLEIPQSINATHDKANKKWAQSWWNIRGYTRCKPKDDSADQAQESARKQVSPVSQPGPAKTMSQVYDELLENRRAVTPPRQKKTREKPYPLIDKDDLKDPEQFINKLLESQSDDSVSGWVLSKLSGETRLLLARYEEDRQITVELRRALATDLNRLISDPESFTRQVTANISPSRTTLELIRQSPSGDDRIRLNRFLLADAFPGALAKFPPESEDDEPSEDCPKSDLDFVDLANDPTAPIEPLKNIAPFIDNRKVRTVELIPRQSSLNVNDLKLRNRAGALTAVATFLFGFGLKLNYQRQREQFSQFVQQELYSSGFGKGAREFGWTFMPMPGTDRLFSGVRTTYAVVIVPQEATSVVLESTGCYFPRNHFQPANFDDAISVAWTDRSRESRYCNGRKAFLIPIPAGGHERNKNFYVTGVTYHPVAKGERVVVSIYGRNFSSQIGVLIDGIPLPQALGLAQPYIRDDSDTGEKTFKDLKDEKIRGRIERIDSNQIVASFERIDGKVGTPVITLVAPGKAKDLNGLQLYINGKPNTRLSDRSTPWMIGRRPDDRPSIENVEIFSGSDPRKAIVLINGEGFTATQRVFINGAEQKPSPYVSPKLMRAEIATPIDGKVQITLLSGTDRINSLPVTNPAYLRINSVNVLSYDAGGPKSPAVLVVKLQGTGFTEDMTTSVGEIVVQSATEAILKLKDPESAVVVTLTNPRTGAKVKTIVTRKTAPE